MAVDRRLAVAVSFYPIGPSIAPSGTINRVGVGYGYTTIVPVATEAVIKFLTNDVVRRAIHQDIVIRRVL